MFASIFHLLLSPLIDWDARYRSRVVADWLIENDADFAAVVNDFKPKSKHYEMSRFERKSWRRSCLRRLRSSCSDPAVRAVIHDRYPPLSGTWS